MFIVNFPNLLDPQWGGDPVSNVPRFKVRMNAVWVFGQTYKVKEQQKQLLIVTAGNTMLKMYFVKWCSQGHLSSFNNLWGELLIRQWLRFYHNPWVRFRYETFFVDISVWIWSALQIINFFFTISIITYSYFTLISFHQDFVSSPDYQFVMFFLQFYIITWSYFIHISFHQDFVSSPDY